MEQAAIRYCNGGKDFLFPITNRATGGIIDEGLVQAVGV